jgi:CRP-like cAMP-binding protein
MATDGGEYMLDKWHETMARSMLFQKITMQDMKTMLDCMNPRIETYMKGEIAARWGEPMTGLGILLEGGLSVLKESPDGSRIIIHILSPGELFGEMAVFTEERLWPATIQAQEDSVIALIPPDEIVSSCSNACYFHRQMIMNMLGIVSERAIKLNRKVEYLSIRSMRGKLCTYFWEIYKTSGKTIFLLPMNRNELAEYLNVSRPSMSREMCRMREEGLIDFHLSTIKILNPEKIAEYVQ